MRDPLQIKDVQTNSTNSYNYSLCSPEVNMHRNDSNRTKPVTKQKPTLPRGVDDSSDISASGSQV